VLATGMYFYGMGSYPLLDPDEGRYAEIPREMLESGDFITPHLNYVKYFEKPPLFYWACAASMRLFGETEGALRAVPAAAGLLTLAVVVLLAWRIAGAGLGVLAGWVYLTSLMPLLLSRYLIIDGLFTLCLACTWASWWLGYASPSRAAGRNWYAASWFFLALALLAKGPVAIVLSGGVVLVFVALQRDWKALLDMLWWPGPALFLLVGLPWFVLVSLHNPEFLHFFVVVQHFERFAGREHAKPFYFFFPIFPVGLGGWAFVGLAALFWAAARAPTELRSYLARRRQPPPSPPPSPKPPRLYAGASTLSHHWGRYDSSKAPLLYLLVWVGVVLGFFSASSCKLVTYILPAYPAMAILVAGYVRSLDRRSVVARVLIVLSGVLLVVSGFLLPAPAHQQDVVPYSRLEPYVWMLSAATLLSGLLLVVSAWRLRWLPVAAGLLAVLFVPVAVPTTATVARFKRVGTFCAHMPCPLPQQVKVAEWKCYDQSLGFYTHHRITLIDYVGELSFGSTIGDQSSFFLEGVENLERLARKGPLLANVSPADWPQVRALGLLRPVAANASNVLLANEAFIELTGLVPYPDEAIRTDGPQLLMPRRQSDSAANEPTDATSARPPRGRAGPTSQARPEGSGVKQPTLRAVEHDSRAPGRRRS